MQESVFANLICIIDEKVPLESRLDRQGVLFCLINELFPCIAVRDYQNQSRNT